MMSILQELFWLIFSFIIGLLAVIASLLGIPFDADQIMQGAEPSVVETEPSVLELLENDGSFYTLVESINRADMRDTLQSTKNITIFAPNDTAFEQLPPETVAALTENTPLLKDFLRYHLSSKALSKDDLLSQGEIETLQAAKLMIRQEGETLYVNNAKILITEVRAANGVVYVIDSVLVPPSG